jgi:CheY-like chemotaxis protein
MSALDLGEESLLTENPRKSDPAGEALVLIVDSDPSSAEFMARALTQSEMQVVIADRIAGSAGASMQLRAQPDIGVVVIDPLAVPGRDNLTELREAGLAEDIQVIVVAEPVILGRYAQAARGKSPTSSPSRWHAKLCCAPCSRPRKGISPCATRA